MAEDVVLENDVKPGVQTSEFKATAAVILAAVGTLLDSLIRSDNTIAKAIVVAAAMLGAGVAAGLYALSRARAKTSV